MTAPELKPCPFCGGTPKLMKTMDESLWSHDVVPYHQVWCEDGFVHSSVTPQAEQYPVEVEVEPIVRRKERREAK